MKQYETIDKILSYILKKHKDVRDPQKPGVHGLMMLRKLNGKRIVFGEIEGFRIFDWTLIDSSSVALNTIAVGYGLGSKRKIQQTSRLLLHDLAIINVYDYCAEFLSVSGIDFAYTLNTYSAKIQHLYEWINNKSGILRASWVNKDNDTEKLLEQLTSGRKMRNIDDSGREIDMDFDFGIWNK